MAAPTTGSTLALVAAPVGVPPAAEPADGTPTENG